MRVLKLRLSRIFEEGLVAGRGKGFFSGQGGDEKGWWKWHRALSRGAHVLCSVAVLFTTYSRAVMRIGDILWLATSFVVACSESWRSTTYIALLSLASNDPLPTA